MKQKLQELTNKEILKFFISIKMAELDLNFYLNN